MLALGIATLAFGCRLSPPRLTPRSADITSVTASGLGLRLHFTANNPNRLGVTVRSVTAHVTVAGQDLGTTQIPNSTTLPPDVDVPLDTDVTLAWTNLPALALATLTSPTVPFHVDGTAGVGTSDVQFDVPFQFDGVFSQSALATAAANSVPNLLPILGMPFLQGR